MEEGRKGAVFDVRLRGQIININADDCFYCSDDVMRIALLLILLDKLLSVQHSRNT